MYPPPYILLLLATLHLSSARSPTSSPKSRITSPQTTTAHSSFAQTDWARAWPWAGSPTTLQSVKKRSPSSLTDGVFRREAPQPSDYSLIDVSPTKSMVGPSSLSGGTYLPEPTGSGSNPSGAASASASANPNPSLSDTPAPSHSYAPSPSPSDPAGTNNQTTALALAKQLLSCSSSTCLDPGGGCAVLNLSVGDTDGACTDDACACADTTTLAAMVCATCNAEDESISVYNDFLGVCEGLGIADPSETVEVALASGTGDPSQTGGFSQTGGGYGESSVIGVGLHASPTPGPTPTGSGSDTVLASESGPGVVGGGSSLGPSGAIAEVTGSASEPGMVSPSGSVGVSVSASLNPSADPSTNPSAHPSLSPSPSRTLTQSGAVGLITDMPESSSLGVGDASDSDFNSGSASASASRPSLHSSLISISASTSAPALASDMPESASPSASPPLPSLSHAVALLATDMSDRPTPAAPSVVPLPSSTRAPSASHSASAAPSGADNVLESLSASVTASPDPSDAYLLNTLVSMSTITLASGGVSVVPVPVSMSAGGVGDNATANSTVADSDAALNASVAFFGYEIDGKCDEDCQVWKGLSETCTSDTCICTDPSILSAGSCSSCLGSTTHGTAYQSQIGYYNSFTANCSVVLSGVTPSPTPGQDGYEQVPSALSASRASGTGLTKSSPGSAPGGGDGTMAAVEAVVTKYSDARRRGVPFGGLGVALGVALGYGFGFGFGFG